MLLLCGGRIREVHWRDGRWFGVRIIESSEEGEPSCWTGIRMSDVVEVGQDEYLHESVPAPDHPCSSATKPTGSLGKRKWNRNSMPVPNMRPNVLL